MLLLLRKIWFRASLGGAVILAFGFVLRATNPPLNEVRDALVAAVPAVSGLFALTAGLAMVLITNLVFGLRAKMLEQARRVRQLLFSLTNVLEEGTDPAAHKLVDKHLKPLLGLNLQQFANPNNIPDWSVDLEESLDHMADQALARRILTQYLLPLEDELNVLGILSIRAILVRLHIDLLQGSFLFICFAVIGLVIARILPSSPTGDWLAAHLAAAVCIYAILELLVVLSYVQQEAAEESLDFDEIEDLEEF